MSGVKLPFSDAATAIGFAAGVILVLFIAKRVPVVKGFI